MNENNDLNLYSLYIAIIIFNVKIINSRLSESVYSTNFYDLEIEQLIKSEFTKDEQPETTIGIETH